MEGFGIKYSPKEWAKITKNVIKTYVDGYGYKPSLSIYNTIETPASLSYVKGKIKDCEEVGFEVKYIGEKEIRDNEDLMRKVLNDESSGIIVQKPLREDIVEEDYISLIFREQDVDGARRDSLFNPATPAGIMSWLDGNEIELEGRDVCIVGRSELVGMPLFKLMLEENATVTLCHSKTKNLEEKVKSCEILVVAIGNPNVIQREWLEDGKPRLVIDVGINRVDGKLVGDVPKYDVPEGGYCTPVPGGVGLLTRAALLDNVFGACLIQKNKSK